MDTTNDDELNDEEVGQLKQLVIHYHKRRMDILKEIVEVQPMDESIVSAILFYYDNPIDK